MTAYLDKTYTSTITSFLSALHIPSPHAFAAEIPGTDLTVTTDGVGTKLLLAAQANRFAPIGQDAIAMVANDLLCAFSFPLAFCDTLSLRDPNWPHLDTLAKSLAKAAAHANAPIVGGETAIVPDLLHPDTPCDISVTAIGRRWQRERTEPQPGDVLIGLASSGLHANGYTLARRILGLNPHTLPMLLMPTIIYVPAVRALTTAQIPLHGLVHITGGGWLNLIRLSDTVSYRITALPRSLPVYDILRSQARIDDYTCWTTWNMGIGFIIVIPSSYTEQAIALLAPWQPLVLGTVIDDDSPHVFIKDIVTLP
ncbi:MAG: AIR synthase-related protein [Mariprofundaceae bacterium]|nr:AIR synthase-related protein [Mariprofundaceae bacterium]